MTTALGSARRLDQHPPPTPCHGPCALHLCDAASGQPHPGTGEPGRDAVGRRDFRGALGQSPWACPALRLDGDPHGVGFSKPLSTPQPEDAACGMGAASPGSFHTAPARDPSDLDAGRSGALRDRRGLSLPANHLLARRGALAGDQAGGGSSRGLDARLHRRLLLAAAEGGVHTLAHALFQLGRGFGHCRSFRLHRFGAGSAAPHCRQPGLGRPGLATAASRQSIGACQPLPVRRLFPRRLRVGSGGNANGAPAAPALGTTRRAGTHPLSGGAKRHGGARKLDFGDQPGGGQSPCLGLRRARALLNLPRPGRGRRKRPGAAVG